MHQINPLKPPIYPLRPPTCPFRLQKILSGLESNLHAKKKTEYIAVGQLIRSKSASSGLESAFTPDFIPLGPLPCSPHSKGIANYSLLLAVQKSDWTKIMITSKK